MQAAIKLHTTVLAGQRIEVATPELAEGTDVELVIHRLPHTGEDSEPPSSSRYPEWLNTEYKDLIRTQWKRTLTDEEETRLAEIKAEIDAIDSASEENALFERQIAKIREQLAGIRREAEALPDAAETP